MDIKIYGNDSIWILKDWKKGDKLTFNCVECGKMHEFLLNVENTEDTMYNKTLECDCGREIQIIF